MTDLKKVTRGLECCKEGRCDLCPYSFDEEGLPNNIQECTDAIASDALALLKAQEERIKFLDKWVAYLEGGDPYEGTGVLSHD